MKIAICIAVAFLLSGISQVMKALSARVIDRPSWAINPTFGKMILVAATWFVHPFMLVPPDRRARHYAFGLLGVLVQLFVLASLTWLCISIATYFFDNAILQLIITSVILIASIFLIMPVISVVMMPLMAILALPIDLLFPKNKGDNPPQIDWCRNCKHYRKSKDYEDTIRGFWRADGIPRSDKLPCSIPLETSDVWKEYYSAGLSSRRLFPEDCPYFAKR
jgi:hypothetical protein